MSRYLCGSSTVLAISFATLLRVSTAEAGTYYVATSGDNSNDGTAPDKAWRTVTYAATQAAAGDTVYIKAGLYVDEAMVVQHTGSEGAPIIFEGYQNTPGDNPDLQYQPGDVLDSSVVPVFEAVDPALRDYPWGGEPGIAVDIRNKSYIEIRNLAVTKYYFGLYPRDSDHIVFDNVVAIDFGSAPGQSYGDGYGVWFWNCSYSTLRNSVVADATMQNLTIQLGHHNLVENCRTYAIAYDLSDYPLASDYHILIQDSHDNTIRNCRAENTHWRAGGHQGHGIGIKDVYRDGYANPHSYNNKIIDCAAYEMGEHFFVAHEAYNNEFINCVAASHVGEYPAGNSWSEGINIRDGSHHNAFRGCRISGVRTTLTFQDTVEGPEGTQVANNNLVANSIFVNSSKGIEIMSADDNAIVNCVFDKTAWWTLVHSPARDDGVQREDSGNTCRNSIMTNAAGSYQIVDAGTAFELAFTYTDFWANNFGMPAGAGNLAADPLFHDAENSDYHLESQQGRFDVATSTWVKDDVTSPCVDVGDPADDYSGEPCLHGDRINMGAYGGTAQASQGALTESCACENGATRACYNGPDGTAGVGACVAGEQACLAQTWGSCSGQVTPQTEVCGDSLDNDCDGAADEPADCPELPCDGGACADGGDADGGDVDGGDATAGDPNGGDSTQGDENGGDSDADRPGVKDAPANLRGECGCQAGGGASGLMGAAVLVVLLLARRRVRRKWEA